MSIFIGTDILNHFDLPNEIRELSGSFRYRYFEPDEQVSEHGQREGGPRYIKLDWTGEKFFVPSDGFRDKLVHRKNLFFPSDLNTGFCILQTEEESIVERQEAVLSDNSTVSSKLDYLLTSINSSDITESIEENIVNPNLSNKDRIPILDPTTNRPIQRSTIFRNKDQPPDIYIKKSFVTDVIESSNLSPINLNNLAPLTELADTISKEAQAKEDARNGRRLLTTLSYAIQRLNDQSDPNDPSSASLISMRRRSASYLQNWGLIGYSISKYRIEGDQSIYMYSRVVFERLYRDPHVAYGRTYRYEIRPVFAKYLSEGSEQILVMGSDESSNITITCEELRAPSPPKNLNFEYVLGGNVRVEWQRPESYVDDENQAWDTDDIKGYQLFVRNSLHEPYRLVKYFTFNNTYPRSAVMYSRETISDDYIISSEYDFPDSIDRSNIPRFYEFKEYTVDIRPNTNYYFALCSIDAHGNSSNLSAQYKVRRDNVTGEVDIQLACPEGAPKQYPNILIPGKLALPSFKSS